MKSRILFKSLLTLTALAGIGLTGVRAVDKEDGEDKDQSRLESLAKVSKAEAEKAARAKAPNGKLIDSEIEEEDEKVVWSFEFSGPDSKDKTEVKVDAVTGKVVKIEVESPDDETDGTEEND